MKPPGLKNLSRSLPHPTPLLNGAVLTESVGTLPQSCHNHGALSPICLGSQARLPSLCQMGGLDSRSFQIHHPVVIWSPQRARTQK